MDTHGAAHDEGHPAHGQKASSAFRTATELVALAKSPKRASAPQVFVIVNGLSLKGATQRRWKS